MKKLLLFLLAVVLSVTGFSQGADAALGAFYFRNTGGALVSASTLTSGTQYTLNLPIFNTYTNPIPAGGTVLTITVGPNISFIGTGVVANNFGNQYFTTTIDNSDATNGPKIVLNQTAQIPPDFEGLLVFNVNVVGTTPSTGSNITGIWGVNTPPFTDIAPNNNSASLTYFTTAIVPVKFVSVDATNTNCTVNVSWKVADEINVSHYEVLVSNNGAGFRSVATSRANSVNAGAYSTSFAIPADLKGQVLFVQIREVDVDGKVTLSNIKTVRGNCDNAGQLIVHAYPNPVTSTSFINVGAKEGIFNGKYKLELLDNNGKLYQVKEVTLNNQVSVQLDFNQTLSPGRYIIRVSQDGAQVGTVQFIKVGGVL